MSARAHQDPHDGASRSEGNAPDGVPRAVLDTDELITPAVTDPQTLDPSLESGVARDEPRVRRPGAVAIPGAGYLAAMPRAIRRLKRDLAETGPIRSGRLAGLTLGAAIWTLAWPILAESALNTLIGLVDTWLAAHASRTAIDAVGGAAYLVWFVGLITMAISVGATALIARSIGAGRAAIARAALGQAILLAVIGGVLTALLLASVARPLAVAMSLSGDAAAEFVGYLRAFCVGIPFSTILFVGNACCRGAGDARRPLMVMVAVNVVNLVASWGLAYGAGMGVVGIGLGTALAHLAGAIAILGFLLQGTGGLQLRRHWLRLHRVTTYRLLRLGFPNFLETFGMWFANLLIALMVGLLSADAARKAAAATGLAIEGAGGMLGSHLIAIRLEAFSFLCGFAMGTAAGALCGQFLGAGSVSMARKAVLVCAGIGALIMGLMGLVYIFGGTALTAMLTGDPRLLDMAPRLLFITGLVQVPFAIAIVFRSALHGAGDVRAVMWMTWISQWGLRLPLAYALSGVNVPVPAWLSGREGVVIENPFPFDWGLPGLWIGLSLEICIRCAIYTGRLAGGRWARARV